MHWTIWICVIALLRIAECQQRVAPGVPPQQYQQPHGHDIHQMPQVPQQQYQHPPPPQPHHQQPGHQQQHPPQHHQPMHHQPAQQQQHVPAQHGHAHGHDHHGQQILNAANIAEERSHIAEHMEVPIDTSKMSEQELQFHYFKMHDSDGNNKLDGCELIKSLIHWHEQGSHKDKPVGEKLFKDEELTNLIDPILNTDDTNRDGYIDYPEFIQAQQKAAATGRAEHH